MPLKKIRKKDLQEKLAELATHLRRASNDYPPMKLLAVLLLTETLYDLTTECQEEALLFLQTDIATAVLEVAFEGHCTPNEWLQGIFDEIFEEPLLVIDVPLPLSKTIKYETSPEVSTPVIELRLGGQNVTFELEFSCN